MISSYRSRLLASVVCCLLLGGLEDVGPDVPVLEHGVLKYVWASGIHLDMVEVVGVACDVACGEQGDLKDGEKFSSRNCL